MTNEQYAEAVVKKIGWKQGPTTRSWVNGNDFYVITDNPYSTSLPVFDPATDPASAMAWETWLMDNIGNVDIGRVYRDRNRPGYYCMITSGYSGMGETPLLALKAASEKFLEENK